MDSKTLPRVGLSGAGYERKQNTRMPGIESLDRGLGQFSRGVHDVANIRQPEENVSPIIEEARRKLFAYKNKYDSLQGEAKVKFWQEEGAQILDSLRNEYAALPKTRNGGERVFNALNTLATNMFINMDQQALQTEEALADGNDQALINGFFDGAASAVDPGQLEMNIQSSRRVLIETAKRKGLPPAQTEQLLEDNDRRLYSAYLNTAIEGGDYEQAQARLAWIKTIWGGEGLGDGEKIPSPGEDGASGVKTNRRGKIIADMEKSVDSLRVRQTSTQAATYFMRELKIGPAALRIAIDNGTINSNSAYMDMLKKNAISIDDLRNAALRKQGEGESDRDRWARQQMTPALELYDANAAWEDPKVQKIYKSLLSQNTPYGDEKAHQLAEMWKRRDEARRNGRQEPTDQQWRNWGRLKREAFLEPDSAISTQTADKLNEARLRGDITDDQYKDLINTGGDSLKGMRESRIVKPSDFDGLADMMLSTISGLFKGGYGGKDYESAKKKAVGLLKARAAHQGGSLSADESASVLDEFSNSEIKEYNDGKRNAFLEFFGWTPDQFHGRMFSPEQKRLANEFNSILTTVFLNPDGSIIDEDGFNALSIQYDPIISLSIDGQRKFRSAWSKARTNPSAYRALSGNPVFSERAPAPPSVGNAVSPEIKNAAQQAAFERELEAFGVRKFEELSPTKQKELLNRLQSSGTDSSLPRTQYKTAIDFKGRK